MAGRLSSGLSKAVIRASKPRRFRPAAARMIASNSPSSSFLRRVLTLPRSGTTSMSGRRARSCACRLRLELPMRAPGSRSAKPLSVAETKASVGLARSSTAAMQNPAGISAGTSFIECTAMSALPSSMRCSSSFTNRPLPPIFASGVSKILSPWVLMPKISTSRPASLSHSAANRATSCSVPVTLSIRTSCWTSSMISGGVSYSGGGVPAALPG